MLQQQTGNLHKGKRGVRRSHAAWVSSRNFQELEACLFHNSIFKSDLEIEAVIP